MAAHEAYKLLAKRVPSCSDALAAARRASGSSGDGVGASRGPASAASKTPATSAPHAAGFKRPATSASDRIGGTLGAKQVPLNKKSRVGLSARIDRVLESRKDAASTARAFETPTASPRTAAAASAAAAVTSRRIGSTRAPAVTRSMPSSAPKAPAASSKPAAAAAATATTAAATTGTNARTPAAPAAAAAAAAAAATPSGWSGLGRTEEPTSRGRAEPQVVSDKDSYNRSRAGSCSSHAGSCSSQSDGSTANEYAEGLGCADRRRHGAPHLGTNAFEFDSHPREEYFEQPRSHPRTRMHAERRSGIDLQKGLGMHQWSSALNQLEQQELRQLRHETDGGDSSEERARTSARIERRDQMLRRVERKHILRQQLRAGPALTTGPLATASLVTVCPASAPPAIVTVPVAARKLESRPPTIEPSAAAPSVAAWSAVAPSTVATSAARQPAATPSPAPPSAQHPAASPSVAVPSAAVPSVAAPSAAAPSAAAPSGAARFAAFRYASAPLSTTAHKAAPSVVTRQTVGRPLAPASPAAVPQSLGSSTRNRRDASIEEVEVIATVGKLDLELGLLRRRFEAGLFFDEDVARALATLERLRDLPITEGVLRATGVGTELNLRTWRDHRSPLLALESASLVKRWRAALRAARNGLGARREQRAGDSSSGHGVVLPCR